MRRILSPARSCRSGEAFTVVELLVVITVILILAGLILATSGYVQNKGARSRAEAEIAAMSAALENYKADNGIYPAAVTVDARTQGDPALYQAASAILYQALAGTPTYMSFKSNQLGLNGSTTYVKDPFGNSYGYSTIYNGTKGYNPTFDLWSTAGLTIPPGSKNDTVTPRWIKNW